jgi:hypothetical protein
MPEVSFHGFRFSAQSKSINNWKATLCIDGSIFGQNHTINKYLMYSVLSLDLQKAAIHESRLTTYLAAGAPT